MNYQYVFHGVEQDAPASLKDGRLRRARPHSPRLGVWCVWCVYTTRSCGRKGCASGRARTRTRTRILGLGDKEKEREKKKRKWIEKEEKKRKEKSGTGGLRVIQVLRFRARAVIGSVTVDQDLWNSKAREN